MAQKRHPSLTAHLLKDPLRPFPWYRIMREQHPVYYSPEFNSWFISRYNDVQRIINDPELFSSQQTFRRRRPPSEEGKTAKTLLIASSFVYGVKSLSVTFREVL